MRNSQMLMLMTANTVTVAATFGTVEVGAIKIATVVKKDPDLVQVGAIKIATVVKKDPDLVEVGAIKVAVVMKAT